MPDYQRIYENDAERYQRLVAAEDYRGELAEALQSVAPLRGARVIEVGVGTGRITRLLLDGGASVIGYERSPAMMSVARRLLGDTFVGHVADIRGIRLAPQSGTIAIAGWVLGHFCEWYGEHWQLEIDGVLRNMWDALESGGMLIILETLGTGTEHAGAPNRELAAYYELLEREWNMHRLEIRTDYRFDSIDAARQSVGFFFGAELERRVVERNWLTIPEWTGLWWRRK
jgi:SAM-dependent methyltransferase